MEGILDERLAKLLTIALDGRCSDGERLAAMNAAAKMAEPGSIEAGLVFTPRARHEVSFSFGMEQQLEILQFSLDEKDRQIAAAEAQIEHLKMRLDGVVEDGIRLKAIIALTGLSRATLYRRMAAGTFPLPCTAEGTRKIWSRKAVAEWKQARKSPERIVATAPEAPISHPSAGAPPPAAA